MPSQHRPVMLKEVLFYLQPKLGEIFIDCTLGGASYTFELAKRVGERGKILALDLDQLAIAKAKEQLEQIKINNVILVCDNFKNLENIVKRYLNQEERKKIAGLVFDLGLSSDQLADTNRGFSFLLDTPLKMNFGQDAKITADQIVNQWPEKEIAKILQKYGEEKFAKIIARKITQVRKKQDILTTGQLVEIIKQAVPRKYLFARLHPATKTFQALRIIVNQELDNLQQVLPQAVELLTIGGRLVIISYHSLEDRIVKKFFKQEASDCLCPSNLPACRCHHQARLKILTKKVIRPSEEEVRDNPRARSAKLRVVERISDN